MQYSGYKIVLKIKIKGQIEKSEGIAGGWCMSERIRIVREADSYTDTDTDREIKKH